MILVTIPNGVYQDSSINMALSPATNISGWSIAFTLSKRFLSTTPFYQAFVASGMNGVSGITVVDGGQGKFVCPLPAFISSVIVSSGFDAEGNFAIQFRRTDSGAATILSEGFLVYSP